MNSNKSLTHNPLFCYADVSAASVFYLMSVHAMDTAQNYADLVLGQLNLKWVRKTLQYIYYSSSKLKMTIYKIYFKSYTNPIKGSEIVLLKVKTYSHNQTSQLHIFCYNRKACFNLSFKIL